MVGDRPRDGVADPPGGIGRELEAAPVLKAVHRFHEPDVAFLDEVEQGELASQVALGHRDDEAQVGLHELALGLTHHSVMPLDLVERGLQGLLPQADLGLELAHFPRGLELGEALGLPSNICHHPVHEGGLEGQLLDDTLDRRTVLRDPLVVVGARGLAAAPIGEGQLEPLDLALETPDPRESGEERLDLLGLGLDTVGQQDDLVESHLLPANQVGQSEQPGRRHRNASERTAELDLTRLDPSTDRDLVLRREQADLADLLEIQADRILARRGAGTESFLREGWGLFQDHWPARFFLLDLRRDGLGHGLELGESVVAEL